MINATSQGITNVGRFYVYNWGVILYDGPSKEYYPIVKGKRLVPAPTLDVAVANVANYLTFTSGPDLTPALRRVIERMVLE